jgi:hypothetical protein
MPAKGAGAAMRGRDTEGAEYDAPETMWAAELEGANGAGKSEWYSKGACVMYARTRSAQQLVRLRRFCAAGS